MALKIHHIPSFFSISPITLFTQTKHKTRISCTNSNKRNDMSDAALAAEFSERVSIIKARELQLKEAMKKSRKILFKELCGYLDLNEEDTKFEWNKMSEDEKWVLVKRFVQEWGEFFHPLSAKSTKEMVEDYLLHDDLSPKSSPLSSPLFPFDSIIGFP